MMDGKVNSSVSLPLNSSFGEYKYLHCLFFLQHCLEENRLNRNNRHCYSRLAFVIANFGSNRFNATALGWFFLNVFYSCETVS